MCADVRSAQDEGRAALAALDRAIAAKPRGDGHAFSEMTERLCAMRDLLIAEHAAQGPDARGDSREMLERLNAVISTALAGHFPLGNIPWPEVERARGVLAELVGG